MQDSRLYNLAAYALLVHGKDVLRDVVRQNQQASKRKSELFDGCSVSASNRVVPSRLLPWTFFIVLQRPHISIFGFCPSFHGSSVLGQGIQNSLRMLSSGVWRFWF